MERNTAFNEYWYLDDPSKCQNFMRFRPLVNSFCDIGEATCVSFKTNKKKAFCESKHLVARIRQLLQDQRVALAPCD